MFLFRSLRESVAVLAEDLIETKYELRSYSVSKRHHNTVREAHRSWLLSKPLQSLPKLLISFGTCRRCLFTASLSSVTLVSVVAGGVKQASYHRRKMKKLFIVLLGFFPYFVVFVASLYPPSDLDLGWHLRYGEYFFTHGHILRTNTFSTMMPNYQWVNHSWGTDVLTYALFHIFGFFGLSIAAAVVVTLTFFFFSKAAGLSLWDEAILFPVLLILLDPLNAVSFRSQLISLLFLGVLFYIISSYIKQKPKKLFLAIPLFLLWANIHGEFILGLVLFLIWIVSVIGLEVYHNKAKVNRPIFRQARTLLLIFLLAVAVTLINPFGIGVYVETFKYFGNPMQNYISEWAPVPLSSGIGWRHIGMTVVSYFGILGIYFTGKFKEKFPFILFAFMFTILPLWAERYAWPGYYIMLFVLFPITHFFKLEKKKLRLLGTIGLLTSAFAFTFILKFPFSDVVDYSWDKYCRNDNIACSPNSAEFLSQHHLDDKLFSDYGWGGWLIWNYPNIKPTIDGRMPFWEDADGYSGFKEYLWYEQNFSDIDKSRYNVVYMSPNKPIYKRMEQLDSEGKWELVYQDSYAGIFVRQP